jgi:Streptomyces sporulation and cell division protein, SsgA
MNELYELIEDVLHGWVFTAEGTEMQMVIEVAWRRCDPWAIELTFPGRDGDVVWLIGRDLLLAGLLAPAGHGDVRVFPSGPDERAALHLSSPNGQLFIELEEFELEDFLNDTYTAVPAGEELLWIPLDQELAELLDGSEL